MSKLLKLSKLAIETVCKQRINPNYLIRTLNKTITSPPPLPSLQGKIAPFNIFYALSILKWLGFEQDDEKKESELIMTLKRAVLCTQRQEYDKAEKMLHIALRLAQQQQNQQGVLYCYDLMANLAFDRLELDKAEKLFIAVMQMLLSNGTEVDDPKTIHISLKLSRISHLKAEEEKAELGYRWCLQNIEPKKNDSLDMKLLYGVIQDWYAQFLLDKGDVQKSLLHLKEAYEVCKIVEGEKSEQNMLLLNDLGITMWRAGDMKAAENYLNNAVKVSKDVEDKSHVGVVHANLGLILLQKGLTEKAKNYCDKGLRLGKKYENVESVEQSKYCLEQIKISLENVNPT